MKQDNIRLFGEAFLMIHQRFDILKVCKELNIHPNSYICKLIDVFYKLKNNLLLNEKEILLIEKKNDEITIFLNKLYELIKVEKENEVINTNNKWLLTNASYNLMLVNTKKGYDYVNKAIKIDNLFIPAIYLRGIKYYANYHYAKKSISDIEKIEKEIHSAYLLEMLNVKLSKQYFYNNQDIQAIIHAKKAVNINSNAYTNGNLGYIYHGSKNNKEAEKYYIKSIKIYPHNIYRNMLGWLYLDEKKYDKAEKLFLEIANSDKIYSSYLPIFRFLTIMNKKEMLKKLLTESINKQGKNKYNEAYITFLCNNVECLERSHKYFENKYHLDKWLTEVETRLILLNQSRIFHLNVDFSWKWNYEMFIRYQYFNNSY